jgi:multimeric flavodoxin WrbA
MSGRERRAPGQGPWVLGIAGSPRRGGNSDRMLDAALEGVEAAGVATRRLVVVDSGVGPCRGCDACKRDGRCVRRDGMDEVYPLLDAAAGIVVSSPAFFASVPSELKALIDRCQPYWVRRYILGEPRPETRRPGGVLIAAGGGDPFGTECVDIPVRSAFGVLSVEALATVVAEPVDEVGDIFGKPDVLDACRRLGGDIGRRAGSGT